MKLTGLPVSDGICIGKCKIIRDKIVHSEYSIEDVKKEQDRFKSCVLKSKKQILALIEDIETGKNLEGIDVNIFKAHILILEDPMFYKEVHNKISTHKKNVESILNDVVEDFVTKFESSNSDILKDRAADIKDVGFRIISNLQNSVDKSFENLSDVIIVAEELTPTQLLHFAAEGVSGVVTEKGGITSHVAIFSRSLEIPALTGVKNLMDFLSDGEFIVVDTEEKQLLFNLTEKEIAKYVFLKKQYDKIKKRNKATKKLKSVTKDGIDIRLAANIQLTEEIKKIKEYGIKNIGLFRTEFLFMDRKDIPDEDEQFKYYKKVASAFNGDYIVIRTLDAGGDKEIASINSLKNENNPFLGWRGIRICLDRPDIFKTQIKAIMRAAAFGNVKIMYPMISSAEQFDAVQEIFEAAKNELQEDNYVFNGDIEQGVLIEIPAAMMYMDYFTKKADFISIGTNDLLQFLTAVDRTNNRISNMYSWYNKALFNFIEYIVKKAKKNNKKVQICGEIASDPLCLPVLIGVGVAGLSMVASAIPKIKLLIRSLTVEECKEIAKVVLKMDRDSEIKNFLSNRFKEFMSREEVINEMSQMWEGK